MAKIDLSKYGITGTTEIVYNPSYEMLFEEGKEAMFFSSNEELLRKTEDLIQHPEKCREIARAGRERCLKSGYSNREMIRSVLSRIANENTIHI